MKPINVKLLKRLGACQEQVDTFYSIYGDSDAPLTVEEAVKQALVFDLPWLAFKVFKGKDIEEFKRIRNSAYEEYERIYMLAVEKFGRNFAWEDCKQDIIKAYREYELIKAKAFAEIYLRG